MTKSCVICGSDESEDVTLIEAPCNNHFVCTDDIVSFFENAINNESLFPPQCCDQIFMLGEYEDHIPFEVLWKYRVKQDGEYTVPAKYRVYCADPHCARFLHPSTYVEDKDNDITYAVCEAESCGKITCVRCKALLQHEKHAHECGPNEEDRKFKQMATEKGYKACPVCGVTVELAEACNHVMCGCGNSFCYVCGEQWEGMHGCPQYGPAVYDEQGYNQDGFHRDTGLNREGLDRRGVLLRDGEADDGNGYNIGGDVLGDIAGDMVEDFLRIFGDPAEPTN